MLSNAICEHPALIALPIFPKKRGLNNSLAFTLLLVDIGCGAGFVSVFGFIQPPKFRVFPFSSNFFDDSVCRLPSCRLVRYSSLCSVRRKKSAKPEHARATPAPIGKLYEFRRCTARDAGCPPKTPVERTRSRRPVENQKRCLRFPSVSSDAPTDDLR